MKKKIEIRRRKVEDYISEQFQLSEIFYGLKPCVVATKAVNGEYVLDPIDEIYCLAFQDTPRESPKQCIHTVVPFDCVTILSSAESRRWYRSTIFFISGVDEKELFHGRSESATFAVLVVCPFIVTIKDWIRSHCDYGSNCILPFRMW